jgi:hypothetical protein
LIEAIKFLKERNEKLEIENKSLFELCEKMAKEQKYLNK